MRIEQVDPSPRASARLCAVHAAHSLVPTYSESHHVIPQAWQIAWKPAAETPTPYAGPSPDHPGVILWDARRVNVCRTGHGNVHYWIVLAMRVMHDAQMAEPTAAEVHRLFWTVARGHVPKANRLDLGVAEQAVIRFRAVGGDLSALWAARQFGAI